MTNQNSDDLSGGENLLEIDHDIAFDRSFSWWIKAVSLALTWLFIISFSVFFMYTVCTGIKIYHVSLQHLSQESSQPVSAPPNKPTVKLKDSKQDKGAIAKTTPTNTSDSLPKSALFNLYHLSIWIALTAALVTTALLAILKYVFRRTAEPENDAGVEPPLLSATVGALKACIEALSKKG